MNRIKELLKLLESSDNFTSEDNLKAVMYVLSGNKSIPIQHDPHENDSLFKFICEQNGNKLYYLSLEEPYGDLEAFVVEGKDGKCSYYDSTNNTVVLNGKVKFDKTPSYISEAIEEAIDEYAIDGSSPNRPPKKDAIFYYLSALSMD